LASAPVCCGAWAIGGSGWQFAWGGQDDRDSIATIREALGSGVNWIDTAAVYGLGHSEEIVARALDGVPIRPYVFTKCSMVWDKRRKIGHSLKAQTMLHFVKTYGRMGTPSRARPRSEEHTSELQSR